MARKALVIFGAGASYADPDVTPYRAPLGADLWRQMCEKSGARDLVAPEVAEQFEATPFESAMAALSEQTSPEYNPLLRLIAVHLARLRPPNRHGVYQRLIQRLGSDIRRTVFATLNYDTLLEQSLNMAQVPWEYSLRRKIVPVLKIHGSVGFLPDLSGLSLRGSSFKGCGTNVETNSTVATIDPVVIERWCSDPTNQDIAPAMAMYAPGKRCVYNRTAVDQQQELWRSALEGCREVYLVGVALARHDSHFWEPLATARKPLTYLAPARVELENVQNWCNEVGIARFRGIERSFSEGTTALAGLIRSLRK